MWQEVERYLQSLVTDVAASPNTIAAYRNDLTQFYQFLMTSGSDSPASRLSGDPEDLTSWTAVSRVKIVAFVVSLKDKGYAVTTIARKIAAVKSFFHFLRSTAVIQTDPTESIDSPKIDKTLPRSLSAEELNGLLQQPAGQTTPDALRDNAMLHVLYSTGLRVSELVALDIGDVDLSSGYARCVGKSGRERIIPLDPETVEILDVYLKAGRNALIERRDELALFVNQRGHRLTRQGFWLILKEHAKNAGLSDNVTPQTLRHSFAVRMLGYKTDLREVQELLGHANIATTQVYTQLVDGSRRSFGGSIAEVGISPQAVG